MTAAPDAQLRSEHGDGVPGWYGYEAFHAEAVRTAPPGALLVEVGVFCGLSLIHLARLARGSGKGLRVVGVDWFRGSAEHLELLGHCRPGCLIHDCWLNLEANGVLDDVALIAADSAAAASLFADGSCWAVFLDGDHSEAGVRRDIAAWAPKVAPGGFLGGDDHDAAQFPGVVAAVDDLMPRRTVHGGRWWTVRRTRGE